MKNLRTKLILIVSVVLLCTNGYSSIAQKPTPANLFMYRIEDDVITITGWKDRKGKLDDIIVPESIKGKPVKKIGKLVYISGKAYNVILPNSISEIEDEAFLNVKLKAISLPNSITRIGKRAFVRSELTKVKLPDGLTEIEDETFKDCKALKEIIIPDGIVKIGKEAFSKSGLTEIVLPNSLAVIDGNAFKNSKIISLILPGNLKEINYDLTFDGRLGLGGYPFDGNPLKFIEIPQGYENKEIFFYKDFKGWYTLYEQQAGRYTFEDGKWYLENKEPPPYGIIKEGPGVIIRAINGETKNSKHYINNNEMILPEGKYIIGVIYQNIGVSFSDAIMYYDVNLTAGSKKSIQAVINGRNIGYSVQDEK